MMERLLSELRRRNVFRVAGVYAVVAWLAIQIVVAVKAPLSLPGWTDTLVIVLFAIGFPVALVLAWAFEMTPEGVKLTKNVADSESVAAHTGRKLDYAILAGLALVVILAVADRLTPESAQTVAAEETNSGAAPSAASIAVLPFADLSPGKDQEYFSDGVAEEILNVLAKVNGLEVASRTSSFAFKGQATLGIPAIAKELRVRHVLEGSVRKSGDALRITAQLIDAADDRHLWSETYDRPLTAENVFAVQDEIAAAIVAALFDVMKTPAAAAPAVEVEKSTPDLSAYDLYLKARALYQRRENLKEAEALLGQAVMRDQNFADAWALRAATLSLFKEYTETDLSYEDIGKLVDAYADRALALNPDNARAIAARANFRMTAAWNLALKYDIGAIAADLKRAVALDARDSSAMNWLGMIYALVGESDQAAETFAACATFDPFFGPCAENYYDLLVVQERYDEALAHYQQVLAKGIVVSGWTNFTMLAHFDQKVAFMQATNHPSGLEGWRRHEDLYEAFKRPGEDHSALISEINEYLSGRPRRGLFTFSNLLIPLGGHDATPFATNLWGPDYARYRRSPQFKTYIRDSGVHDYWKKHGFPPQCKPARKADFECD
jgi:TolB-like protein